MMPSLGQFDFEALFHEADPDTSKIAARSQLHKLSRMHEIILTIFAANPDGLASFELADIYQAGQVVNAWPIALRETPIKRKSDLARMGCLVVTLERRINRHGAAEAVWRIA